MKPTKAFTLIELLVVISIIAVLVSLLIPALGKAKDQAKKVYCSSNLRSLTIAVSMYARSNVDETPYSTNRFEVPNGWAPGWCGATHTLGTNQSLPLEEQIEGNSTDLATGLMRGLLWPYVESTKGWRCPADPDDTQLRSYCMAAEWFGTHTENDNSVWYDPGTAGLVYRKLSQIRHPASRFMFVDQIGQNTDAYFAIWYSRPRWWNIPNYLHRDSSVNGFADGHVEAYKLEPETVELAEEALGNANAINGDYFMIQEDFPDNEDLKYYQRASWGHIGWR